MPIGGAGLGPGRITGLTLGEGVGVAAKEDLVKKRSSINSDKTIRTNFFTKTNYTRRSLLLKLEVGDVGAGKVFDNDEDQPDDCEKNQANEGVSERSPGGGEGLGVATRVDDSNSGHDDHHHGGEGNQGGEGLKNILENTGDALNGSDIRSISCSDTVCVDTSPGSSVDRGNKLEGHEVDYIATKNRPSAEFCGLLLIRVGASPTPTRCD